MLKHLKKESNSSYPSNDGYNFAFGSFLIGVHMRDLWTHKITRFIVWEFRDFPWRVLWIFVILIWSLLSSTCYNIKNIMMIPFQFEAWWVMWICLPWLCCAPFWVQFALIIFFWFVQKLFHFEFNFVSLF